MGIKILTVRLDQRKDWHYLGSCDNTELLFLHIKIKYEYKNKI